MSSIDAVMEHRNNCPYKNFIGCPYAVVPTQNCNWKGPSTSVRHHIQTDHGINVTEVSGIFVSPLPDLRHEMMFREQFIFTMSELFFCFWEMVDNDICFSMFYVGPNNRARNFHYNILVGASVGNGAYCRTNCRIRHLDERNGYCRASDYVLIPSAHLKKGLHISQANELQYSVEILSVI
jgi:hypothetical protein